MRQMLVKIVLAQLPGLDLAEHFQTAPAPPPPPAPVICNKYTGGSCYWWPIWGLGPGCSGDRGPTECLFVSDIAWGAVYKCLCAPGYCANENDGKCSKPAPHCDTWTPGECKVLGCSKTRGDAYCDKGTSKCVCKEGACSQDGVCSFACKKDTGGTCNFHVCARYRNAECRDGKCMCRPDDCSFEGICYSGNDFKVKVAMAKNRTIHLQEHPAGYFPFLCTVLAVPLMMLFVAILIWRAFRRFLPEPLLHGYREMNNS